MKNPGCSIRSTFYSWNNVSFGTQKKKYLIYDERESSNVGIKADLYFQTESVYWPVRYVQGSISYCYTLIT